MPSLPIPLKLWAVVAGHLGVVTCNILYTRLCRTQSSLNTTTSPCPSCCHSPARPTTL
ncbi:hypothetical protein BDQ12DRAFT_161303 [Crucibulum laeve]|uniref:Uncharacterized protein n=1 Tax=Crucibulum laeve TaxID=68775 RepID=A0A5C3LY49_9AGAR|nr:hypothetical protein BDQ12DRAFT_161303 [Crucibulum laeve]